MANELPTALALDKIWWIKDPVPPWIRQILDKTQQIELARVELELQAAVLRSQLKAAEQSLAILGKAGK